jgi:mannonate dehydratase
MEQTWRWFGPEDGVTLAEARQAGATGIVTALHDIPYGVVWTVEAIEARQAEIAEESALGLRWSVAESLPVHESIKTGEGDLEPLFENYRVSLRNLAACGVHTICYNFMPVLDWARTELRYRLPHGGLALRFNAHEFAAFDVLMLERPGAEADHPPDVMARARAWFARSTEADRDALLATVMAGLPGAFDRYDIAGLRRMLARYRDITPERLRANLVRFLEAILPTAEEAGMRMAIHPDDPPRPLLGLPRIVSNADDLAFITGAVDSVANGITLCSGSLGAGPNDVVAIARRFAPRIHFAHLRNVAKEADGSFMEADHLDGDTDMVALVEVLLEEQARRRNAGEARWRIPMRPDHGHELLGDIGRTGHHPGYSATGRLKGLAELRGVMRTLAQTRGLPV